MSATSVSPLCASSITPAKEVRPWRVGRNFYDVLYDWDSGECEMAIWQVRTIRGGRVSAIQRNEWTWVKLSVAHGDWGWARSISPLFRKTWDVGEPLPLGFFTTRRAAWNNLLERARAGKLRIDDATVVDRVIRTATRQRSLRTG